MRSASQHGSCDCDKPRIRILHISRFYFAMIEGASRIPKGGGRGEDLCGSEVMGLWVMGLWGGIEVWRLSSGTPANGRGSIPHTE